MRNGGKKPNAEMCLIQDALCCPQSGRRDTAFGAPCPICGRKNGAVRVRQLDDGDVKVTCRACGAAKDVILRAVGVDMERIRVKEVEGMVDVRMAAKGVVGENRCTVCTHYVEDTRYGETLYGCSVKNQYRKGEVWSPPSSDADCMMFRAERATVVNALEDVTKIIEVYGQMMERMELRRKILTELLEEM